MSAQYRLRFDASHHTPTGVPRWYVERRVRRRWFWSNWEFVRRLPDPNAFQAFVSADSFALDLASQPRDFIEVQ